MPEEQERVLSSSMWGTVVSSVKRVFVERALPHRTLVKSQSLSFESAYVSPLHPTTLVSVQIYQDGSSSVADSEATLTFKEADITYKDDIVTEDITYTTDTNNTATKDDSIENGSEISSYNGVPRSFTFSGLATIKEEVEEISEEDKITSCTDNSANTATNKSSIELDEIIDQLEASNSEDQISYNEEIDQEVVLESSSSEIEIETNNILKQTIGDSEDTIVVEEIQVEETQVEEIQVDEIQVDEIQAERIQVEEIKKTPTTPKKKTTYMQLTNQYRKPKMKKSRTSDTFYIKLGKGDDSIDTYRETAHDTKAVVVDCTDYQETVIPFILAIATALHTCGVPAHNLERMLTILSNCFGVEAQFFYIPTGLFCSFNHPKPIFSKQSHRHMQFIRLSAVDWDLERLCFLEELCDDVITSRLHVSQGVPAVGDIMKLPLRYHSVFEVCAVVILAVGFAVLFGFSWSQSRASGFAGIWTGFMLNVTRKFPEFSNISTVISAVGSGVMVSLFSFYITPIHPLLAALASLMYHLPCLDVTIAISEFTTGNLVAATSRFMGCWAAILQVGFGAWTGITIIESYWSLESQLPNNSETWYWVLFATFLASMGYSILTQIPPKMLWVSLTSGILGTIGSQLGSHYLGTAAGTFLGAFLICIFANLYARNFKRGLALLPIWSGMLLLVPASIGVKGLLDVSNLEITYGLIYIITLLQNATALALGLFSANIFAHPYKAL